MSSALYQRWTPCSHCLSSSLLHLHLSFCLYRTFHFFLLAGPRISLSPLSVSTSPQLICHRCLLSQPSLLFSSLPPPGVVSSSRNPNHDWALSASVYKSNSNLISRICCAIVLPFFVSLYLQTACLYCIMFSRLCR